MRRTLKEKLDLISMDLTIIRAIVSDIQDRLTPWDRKSVNDLRAEAGLEPLSRDLGGWNPIQVAPPRPEKFGGTDYLVYTEYGFYGIATHFPGNTWTGYDSTGDPIQEGEIVAWRPLPGPYREDMA